MLHLHPPSPANNELDLFQQRIRQRRSMHASPRGPRLAAPAWERPSNPPQRYVLHLLVALLCPLSMLIAPYVVPLAPFGAPASQQFSHTDLLAPVVPLALHTLNGDTPVPDAAFAAIDALPQYVLPATRRELLAPLMVAVTVRDTVNMRLGPGTNYDAVGQIQGGEELVLLARYGDWVQARTATGALVWLAAESVTVSLAQLGLLREPPSIPAPPPPLVASVVYESLSLRDGPGEGYVQLARLAQGTSLELLRRTDDWFEARSADGATGWVSGSYLSMEAGVAERVVLEDSVPELNPALLGSVRAATVNLRVGPGTGFGKQGTLGGDTTLELLGRYQDWFKVRNGEREGWVFSDLLAVDPYIARRVPLLSDLPELRRPAAQPAPIAPLPASQPLPTLPEPVLPVPEVVPAPAPAPAPPPSAYAGDLVGFALSLQGIPYVWGGESPEVGFDCSGFTRYVYRQAGLELPHNAAAQYNTAYGVAISDMDSLAPGDLVFFANTYGSGISHVGIYIGDGGVVQALSPGYGVGVANIYDAYWSSHYYGAIRPTL